MKPIIDKRVKRENSWSKTIFWYRHDVATMVQGSAARDVGRHFIQRWNAVKTEKARHHSGFPYLIPKAYANFTPPPTVLNERSHFRGPRVKCQVLRSASDWSAGIEDTESSILSAYEAAIEKSEVCSLS